MKSFETGLTTLGNKKLGTALIDEAVEANRKKLQEKVVQTVAQLLQQVEEHRNCITHCEKSIKHIEAKLAAIKAGEFTMERSGAIQMNDPELVKQIQWIRRCGQCGYDQMSLAPV